MQMNQNELADFLVAQAGIAKFRANTVAGFLINRLGTKTKAEIEIDLATPASANPPGLGYSTSEAQDLANLVVDEWNKPAAALKGDKGDPGVPGPAGKDVSPTTKWLLALAAVIALALGGVCLWKVLSNESTNEGLFNEVATKVTSVEGTSVAAKVQADAALAAATAAQSDATLAKNQADAALAAAQTAVTEARTANASAATANGEINTIKTTLGQHAGAIDALNGAMNAANGEINTIKTTLGNQGIAINDLTGALDETNDKLIHARRSLRTISKELVIVKKTTILPPVAAAQPAPVGSVTVTDN